MNNKLLSRVIQLLAVELNVVRSATRYMILCVCVCQQFCHVKGFL